MFEHLNPYEQESISNFKNSASKEKSFLEKAKDTAKDAAIILACVTGFSFMKSTLAEAGGIEKLAGGIKGPEDLDNLIE